MKNFVCKSCGCQCGFDYCIPCCDELHSQWEKEEGMTTMNNFKIGDRVVLHWYQAMDQEGVVLDAYDDKVVVKLEDEPRVMIVSAKNVSLKPTTKFKVGDRVVLNNRLNDDARCLLAPGERGTVVSIQTFQSCDVVVLGVEMDEESLTGEFALMGDEVDLDREQIESVPDCWEPDVLMAMGYRGLV